MPLLDDLAAHLVADLGLTLGDDLHIGSMRDDLPEEVTVLYEAVGPSDEDTLGGDGSPAVRMASVQVRTRADVWDYETARARCEAARASLVKVVNETLGSTYYLRVSQLNGPVPLGRDEADRWEFVCNLVVSWQP